MAVVESNETRNNGMALMVVKVVGVTWSRARRRMKMVERRNGKGW